MTEKDAPNAVVTQLHSGLVQVRTLEHHLSFLCTYRRGKIFKPTDVEVRERTPVCVGDLVTITPLNQKQGVLEKIFPRKNELCRKAPGKDSQLHVLASNVDQLWIVSSCKQPSFSAGVVDRFLIASQRQGIPVGLVVSKTDLHKESDEEPWKIYEELGLDVLLVSNETGEGIEELKKLIQGQRVLFAGHSGVGKSSLLQSLLGKDFIVRVGEVSESSGKGKHTTTTSTMYFGEKETQIIDTPGVKEFSFLGLEPGDIKAFYPDVSFECDLEDECTHEPEKNCGASRAVRYENYIQIMNSLKE